jgi:enoyl-[acyl-carrier protein] reductase I
MKRCGLVVGVSSERSLGFACVERLRADGAEVLATYRPKPGREELEAKLTSMGATTAQLDARDPTQTASVIAKAKERWGKIDFLVHTLVHVPPEALARPFTELDRQTFTEVIADAAHTLVALCGAARPLLQDSGEGAVVAITSEHSHLVTPRYHVAGVAKAALEATLSYLALELGELGTTCNAVSAPAISTEGADQAIGKAVMEKTASHVAKGSMLKKPVTGKEIAEAVAFLVSERARRITGQVLTVDGGFSKLYF